jgi:hypothetical protein
MRLQTTKLRPFLVFTGLYLAASLPSGTNHVAALTPTRICASIWREPGPGLEEVGEEWGRLVGVVRSLLPAIKISSFIPIKRLTCFGASVIRLGKCGQRSRLRRRRVHIILSRKAYTTRGRFLSLIAVPASPPSFCVLATSRRASPATHAHACIRVIAYRSTTKVLFTGHSTNHGSSLGVSLCLMFIATALQHHAFQLVFFSYHWGTGI